MSRLLFLLVFLAGCGRSLLCENMNSVASQLKFLAKPCANMVTPAAAPTLCSAAATSACTASDHQIMERAAECAESAPACTPGNEASFVAAVLSCTPKLSAACVAAMRNEAQPTDVAVNDYCSDIATSEDQIRAKLTACPGVKLTVVSEKTCRANMDACSAKDERALITALDCKASLTTCKRGEDTAWAAKLNACSVNVSDLSAECADAWD